MIDEVYDAARDLLGKRKRVKHRPGWWQVPDSAVDALLDAVGRCQTPKTAIVDLGGHLEEYPCGECESCRS